MDESYLMLNDKCLPDTTACTREQTQLLQTTTQERGPLLPLLQHKQVSQNSIAAITRTDARVKDAEGKVPLPSASVVSELTQENLNTVFRLWGTA